MVATRVAGKSVDNQLQFQDSACLFWKSCQIARARMVEETEIIKAMMFTFFGLR